MITYVALPSIHTCTYLLPRVFDLCVYVKDFLMSDTLTHEVHYLPCSNIYKYKYI